MVAESTATVVLVVGLLAEWVHARRCRSLARLAFGPTAQPRVWVRLAPCLIVIAMSLATWGFVSLWLLDPKVHTNEVTDPKKIKQLLLVLDVSPSMTLKDAGPQRNQPRRQRASEVLTSLCNRIPMQEYRLSLIAVYSDAKPLLQESKDIEILKYIMEDLPTFLGFKPGKTDLFAGLQMAATTAKKWRPGSATMLVISDGVTVPTSGMPRMPPSVANTLVIGVGDPYNGTFIDGHQSRQDTSLLRQLAHRLNGTFYNANVRHVPTKLVDAIRPGEFRSASSWGRREWALAASASGALIIALLPCCLQWFGTGWKPGAHRRRLTATQSEFGAFNTRLNTHSRSQNSRQRARLVEAGSSLG